VIGVRRVIYASRAVQDFDEVDLLHLLAQARSRNAANGVTGMLVYSSRSFLQLFEGDDRGVEAIWDRIRLDDRHTDLRVLHDGPVEHRSFSDWTMGFEHPADSELEESLPGYRASVGYPFVSSLLLSEAETAETLLELYSRRSA
jgi:hypothetical protein